MENKDKKKVVNLKSVSIASLSLLLILIFLSRTIYNYNLPMVTAVSPQRGTLNKLELTTGIVKYENVSELYSEIGGKIDTILVSEGDVVSKGQAIIEMSFDGAEDDINKQIKACEDDIQKKLSDLKINRDKLQVDIEKINTNISNINRKIDELNQETYKPDTVSDYELTQCRSDITKAEEDLEKTQVLYNAGTVAHQELIKAENNLENLRSKYDNLKKIMDENIDKNNENISDKETNRQKQLKDYAYQLETYNQELKAKTLDLSSAAIQESAYNRELETKISDYRESLQEYEENAVIYAPEDSFVITIAVNQGQRVNANQQLASFGLSKGYILDCEVSLNNNFVVVGDSCVLSNSSHTLEGVVTKVTPSERSKKITISIPSDEITAGETFEIKFEKVSSESYTIVPNGAVNKDSDGYFLNQIKRRNGILGKEFYTEKLRVYIGDSDSENTVIVKGVGFFEPIVLLSDKPYSDGDTIKIKNESDFFED